MKAFTFVRPTSVEEAAQAAAVKGSVLKAGGIDLLDRMKERVDEPERVVTVMDATDASLRELRLQTSTASGGPTEEGSLKIGAAVTLAELASSELVRRYAPALAEAASSAASPQIRHRATLAGNLAQHTRCGYYRHRSFPCLKRGDDTCPVLAPGAVQEMAAVFGNRSCASAHPSSLSPVLAACGALVTVLRSGKPEIEPPLPIADLYQAPKRGCASDTVLGAGDVLVGVQVPIRASLISAYEEVRQKAAFDWSLVSCAVALGPSGNRHERVWYMAGVWLGSVAPTPWRAEAAEKALLGKSLTDETIAAAAEAAVAGATPLPGNAYKVDLVKVVVRRALERLRAMK